MKHREVDQSASNANHSVGSPSTPIIQVTLEAARASHRRLISSRFGSPQRVRARVIPLRGLNVVGHDREAAGRLDASERDVGALVRLLDGVDVGIGSDLNLASDDRAVELQRLPGLPAEVDVGG